MFCEKCGNPVAEGQPFCSVCGTPATPQQQQPAAPAYGQVPGYGYPKPPRIIPPRRPGVALLANFKMMTVMEKVFILCALCGFVLTLILSQFATIGRIIPAQYVEAMRAYGGSIDLSSIGVPGFEQGIAYHYAWLSILTAFFHVAILGTLILTFVGALKNSLFQLIPIIGGGLSLIVFVISWIANSYTLSVAGWFYFIFLLLSISASVVFFIEEKMNQY